MDYKDEALNKFKEYNNDKKARINNLNDEIVELQKQIDDKRNSYHDLITQGNDEKAENVQDEMYKLKNKITVKKDKINLLQAGDTRQKQHLAGEAMNEYNNNLKEYEKTVAGKEKELNNIKAQYMDKVKEIIVDSNKFDSVRRAYSNIPASVGDKHGNIRMSRTVSKNATPYEIKAYDIMQSMK